MRQGVDASSIEKTHERKRARPMEVKEGEHYTDVLVRQVINQEIDLDRSVGFNEATYAGPPYTLLSSTTFTIWK
jgi:hypothetical protein